MTSPQVDDVFQFPKQIHENAITIDQASLQERPLADYLVRTITSLTLSAIDEKEIKSLLGLFPDIRHFSLQKVTIQNKTLSGLPKNIESLHLADCKITTDVVERWFKSMDKSLLSVQIERCCHAAQVYTDGSFSELLKHLPDSVRYLSFHDPISHCINVYKLPPYLEYCYLDMPQDEMFLQIEQLTPNQNQIKTLISRLTSSGLSSSIGNLRKMKNLQNLRVLNSLDVISYPLLKSLKLKNLDVHWYSPPAEKNLVLTLNDDCLLHILSFVSERDWMAISLVHPRFYRLVTAHIYSQNRIMTSSGLLDGFSDKEKKIVQKSLEEHATAVYMSAKDWAEQISRYKKLKQLDLFRPLSKAGQQAIPNGITKLYLSEPLNGGKELFRRLSTSLTSLTLKGHFDPNDLSDLRGLREFKVEEWRGTDLLKILTRNRDLNRLEIEFYVDDDFPFNQYAMKYSGYGEAWGYDSDESSNDDFGFPTTQLQLCPLKSLKVLHITNINCGIELKPSDFPSLEDIYVSFDEYKLEDKPRKEILTSILKFPQLKSLAVDYKVSLEWLSTFKDLESLVVLLDNDQTLDVVKLFPKLSKLGYYALDFKGEAELQKFLIEEKRTITFTNGIVFP